MEKSPLLHTHTLNLVVQEAIKPDTTLKFLQIKCKNIVHQSIKASDKLRCVQEQLSLPQLKLIEDVATRWNSTYLMFEKIVLQHEDISGDKYVSISMVIPLSRLLQCSCSKAPQVTITPASFE